MTYEQAVATAFLNAYNGGLRRTMMRHRGVRLMPEEDRLTYATYALRRLRVRAGLVP